MHSGLIIRAVQGLWWCSQWWREEEGEKKKEWSNQTKCKIPCKPSGKFFPDSPHIIPARGGGSLLPSRHTKYDPAFWSLHLPLMLSGTPRSRILLMSYPHFSPLSAQCYLSWRPSLVTLYKVATHLTPALYYSPSAALFFSIELITIWNVLFLRICLCPHCFFSQEWQLCWVGTIFSFYVTLETKIVSSEDQSLTTYLLN